MKGIAKSAAIITLAMSAAGVAAFSGCGAKERSGEAWGVSHSANYVAYAKITVKGKKVRALTLAEVCLPSYVKAADSVPEADKINGYYKVVTYANVTAIYDANDGYKVGESKLSEYLYESDSHAKAYYQAVMDGNVAVTINGVKDKSVMTKSALSKDENGYWTREDKSGNSYSRWQLNRDATVDYVIKNGVTKLTILEKSSNGKDKREDKDVTYWTDGTIVCGATWTDLNSDTQNKGYYSYVQLILKAYDSAV